MVLLHFRQLMNQLWKKCPNSKTPDLLAPRPASSKNRARIRSHPANSGLSSSQQCFQTPPTNRVPRSRQTKETTLLTTHLSRLSNQSMPHYQALRTNWVLSHLVTTLHIQRCYFWQQNWHLDELFQANIWIRWCPSTISILFEWIVSQSKNSVEEENFNCA